MSRRGGRMPAVARKPAGFSTRVAIHTPSRLIRRAALRGTLAMVRDALDMVQTSLSCRARPVQAREAGGLAALRDVAPGGAGPAVGAPELAATTKRRRARART
jgi:hypothetical protein